MPKRTDIHKVLIIGSGPAVIGQGCEFDYAGTQACRALKSLGYEVVLVNSNPSALMADPDRADVTYIEPLNVDRIEAIIAKERPDALLPFAGGQAGLNLTVELDRTGILDKYHVQVIGISPDAIERSEDRIEFKRTMSRLGIDVTEGREAYSVEEALDTAGEIGYPVIVRPAYTTGGEGSGIAYNREELKVIAARGLSASVIHQVIVEESVLGWDELEIEAMRDQDNHMITVCGIENMDPAGIHTGDSVCVSPMLTVSPELFERMQEQTRVIASGIGIVGNLNVQFAHDPVSDRLLVIELNTRASRSSALASHAAGIPVAEISAMLAAGVTLPELPCEGCGTLDQYTPSGSRVTVKFPRWAFDKFEGAPDRLGTQMRSVGEAIGVGRSFAEAFQKAIRSLDIGRSGPGHVDTLENIGREELLRCLVTPSSERYFEIYEALRKGASVEEVSRICRVKEYYINELKKLADEEEEFFSKAGQSLTPEQLRKAKENGFSDAYLAEILGCSETDIRAERLRSGIVQHFVKVTEAGVEGGAFWFGTYLPGNQDTVPEKGQNPVVVIPGSGPARIGQNLSIDYSTVHASGAFRRAGFETVIVNSSPASTASDLRACDRFYLAPVMLEDLLAVCDAEKPAAVAVQFGGETPLSLAAGLEKNGYRTAGSPSDTIRQVSDHNSFCGVLGELGIPYPEYGEASSVDEALALASSIGYPVMGRPAHVFSGAGVDVIYDDASLKTYMMVTAHAGADHPVIIERFLADALECEADCVCDGGRAFIPAVLEQIEHAGIHSGDSAAVLPSRHIPQDQLDTIRKYASAIASRLHVKGLLNIKFAVEKNKVIVLEAVVRASRDLPLISRVCGISLADLAAGLEASDLKGNPVALPENKEMDIPYCGVKESVLPFAMFPEVDPVLGPEMRSTGEVLGLARTVGEAFYKAEEAAGALLPLEGSVLISLNHTDQPEAAGLARSFYEDGFTIYATDRTCDTITASNIPCQKVKKLYEGRPNIIDMMTNGELNLIINSPSGRESVYDDSYLRKTAIRCGIPYITTIAAARAAADGIRYMRANGSGNIHSLQRWHERIRDMK